MNILIRLPNWMGDAIMATPFIEQIKAHYPKARFTLVGSEVACALFENDPAIQNLYVDKSKKKLFRWVYLYRLAKRVGSHQHAFTLQNSLLSALFLKWTGSINRIGFQGEMRNVLLTHAYPKQKNMHQVQRYCYIAETYLMKKQPRLPLKLLFTSHAYNRPSIGINPGAAYGDAKRWYPERFADVAKELASDYDIVLFGGSNEVAITEEIQTRLQELGIHNVENLAGKTDIPTLKNRIAGLKLFITNDSGPMHIAAAAQVPTVAIFGPTDHLETCQWANNQSRIVRKALACSPCKKRSCPLKHHECMKLVTAEDVLKAAKEIL